MGRPENSLLAIFAIPAAIAVLSTVGLIAALIGDGLLDALSWLGLAVPVAAVALARAFRKQR